MAARPDQRSAEGQARRGHRDQDTDLAHRWRPAIRHGTDGAVDPARHHHGVRLHLQRRGDLPRRRSIRRSPPIRSSRSPPSRPRAARSTFELDRRQRLHAETESGARSRSNEILCWRLAVAALLVAAALAAVRRRAEIPLDERRSGYEFMSRDTRAMQDDDTANPGMLCGARRRGAVEPQGRRRRARPAPTATAMPHQHEGRRGALSGLRHRHAAGRSTSSSASTCAAPSTSRRRRSPIESRELLALTAYVAQQSRGMPIATGDDPQLAPFLEAGARAVHRAPGPAQSLLRAMPRRQLGQEARRQHDPAGAPDRLSALPAGMAEPGLAAAAAAQLPDRACAREPYAYGAPEYCRRWSSILMWRARGMTIETPAVRP